MLSWSLSAPASGRGHLFSSTLIKQCPAGLAAQACWLPASASRSAARARRRAAAVVMAGGEPSGAPAAAASSSKAAAAKYGWELEPKQPDFSGDKRVRELPVAAIRRPLQGVRGTDQEKVAALMRSIEEVGLHEPIDVLEVDGQYYGFSGCHRFEAHQRLGKETILCRVRKANRQALMFHMM